MNKILLKINIFIFILAMAFGLSLFIKEAQASTIGLPPYILSTQSGLVGWWTFDGNDMKNNVADRSGNGNNGALVLGSSGNVATTSMQKPGKIGQALNFDGVDDYIKASPASSINDLGPLTYSVWVYPTKTPSNNYLLAKRRRLLSINSTSIYFTVSTNGTNLSANCTSSSLQPNKWTLISMTWDGVIGDLSGMKFYVNGVSCTTSGTAGSGTAYSDSTCLQMIGAYNDCSTTYNSFFQGLIDDARIYNRALSSSEVLQLYNSTKGSKQATSAPGPSNLSNGLVGWWTMDGNDILQNIADKSGNGNNGALVLGSSGNVATTSMQKPGKIGQALNFDGTDDYIQIPNNSSYKVSYPLSMSAWVKLKSGQTAIINNDSNQSVYSGCLFYVLVGSVGSRCGDNLGAGSGNRRSIDVTDSLIKADKWIYATVVIRGGTDQTFYINGIPSTSSYTYSGTSNLTVAYSSSPATINYPAVNYYSGVYGSGSIDDVRIYNRALSASEVLQLYNSTKGSKQATSAPGPSNLSNGLVGWWTMDGNDILQNIADKSGNGNNGALVLGSSGNVATTSIQKPGKVGQTLAFDGIDDKIIIKNAIDLSSSYTISAWVYPRSYPSNNGDIISNWGGAGAGNASWNSALSSSGKPVISHYNTTDGTKTFSANNALSLNKWHHVVFVYTGGSSGTNAYIYEEGSLDKSGTIAGVPQVSTLNPNIGYGSTINTYWDGYLDDVRVYNRALSSSEVQQLYNMGK